MKFSFINDAKLEFQCEIPQWKDNKENNLNNEIVNAGCLSSFILRFFSFFPNAMKTASKIFKKKSPLSAPTES